MLRLKLAQRSAVEERMFQVSIACIKTILYYKCSHSLYYNVYCMHIVPMKVHFFQAIPYNVYILQISTKLSTQGHTYRHMHNTHIQTHRVNRILRQLQLSQLFTKVVGIMYLHYFKNNAKKAPEVYTLMKAALQLSNLIF